MTDTKWPDDSTKGVLINLLALPGLYKRFRQWWANRKKEKGET